MHILLTRPLDDCKELILKFKSLGHKVSHLPVIKIEGKKYEEKDFGDFEGIIFTSSNAIKNLNSEKINKNIYCFCVGSSTESVAKSKGFQNIYAADGNVSNLREVILQIENNKKIELIAIGIGHDVSRYYSKAVTIMDVDQLGEVLLKELSEVFSKN